MPTRKLRLSHHGVFGLPVALPPCMVSVSRDLRQKAVWIQTFFFALLLMWTSYCAAKSRSQSVTLGWDASHDTNVVGYAVYYAPGGGSPVVRQDAGNNTMVVLAGLPPGVIYYCFVTAYTSDGTESPPSTEIVMAVPVELQISMGTPPGAPAILSFPAVAGHWYELQATLDLQDWTTIWQTSVASEDGWQQYQDLPQETPLPQCFYRLVVH